MQIIRTYKNWNWWQRINMFSLFMLMVGLVLVPVLKMPFMLLFFLSSFGAGNILNVKKLVQQPEYLLLIGFYVWHILGIVIFGKTTKVVYDVEGKLPFILFPIAFALVFKDILSMRNILLKFFIGLLLLFLIFAISRSILFAYLDTGNLFPVIGDVNVHPFFRRNFSMPHHSTYVSMYALLGLSVLFNNYLKNQLPVKYILVSLGMVLIVFFASSRASYYFLNLLLFLSLLVNLFYVKNRWSWLKKVVLAVIVMALFNMLNPRLVDKRKSGNTDDILISKSLEKEAGYNLKKKEYRVIMLEIGMEMVKDNVLFGTGAGCIKEKQCEKIDMLKFPEDYKNYNFHNQYIETWVKTGFIGALLLLVILFFGLWRSIGNRDFLLIVFVLLIASQFMGETLLMKASGVTFFVLFYCLLMLKNTQDEEPAKALGEA
jgi:O-antigen ligase